MKVNLKYRRRGLDVTLPETPGFAGVLVPRETPIIPDPTAALAETLRKPISSPPLSEIARGRRNACVVISDMTRPAPNRILLPPILTTLADAGIRREDTLILIATGLHRPNEGEELLQLVGKEIARAYRVENHVARESADMVFAGRISDDVPVHVNRKYFDADLKILTGFIEPHMWAGFSGGRKSILPGISSLDTVKHMHGPDMIAHEMTTYGALEGNPFHEGGLAIMAKVGADFIANVTLDTAKEITGIFAGHPVQAHLKGCEVLSGLCVHTLKEPLDFIVTTNAGAPLDCNLYQSVKGMIAGAAGLKPGGIVLIATACYEGVGSKDYEQVMNMVDTPEGFLRRLMNREFFLPDQWCAQTTYQVIRRNPTWIYTNGIAEERLKKYHFTPVSSVEDGIRKLLNLFGPNARWAVVPDGPMCILKVAESGAAARANDG